MKRAILAASALALAPAMTPAKAAPDHPVLELRQYRIVPGKRDAFIEFLESHFVESQEALGMRLIGQFRDRAHPDRFTWLRAFPSMAARGRALNDFYFGPVWQAHRGTANPMLDDNDNVLLLKPAWQGAELATPQAARPAVGEAGRPAGMIVATIEYLWKDPGEGYAAYFRDRLAPAYRAAGLPILGAYVAEDQPNDFPRLHVREGERVLVWFTRVSDPKVYAGAMRQLDPNRERRAFLERAPQVLMLLPTPRSQLR